MNVTKKVRFEIIDSFTFESEITDPEIADFEIVGLEIADPEIASLEVISPEIAGPEIVEIKLIDSTRRPDKTLNGAVRTVNCREIFCLISWIIAIFLNAGWEAAMLKKWLCSTFLIS